MTPEQQHQFKNLIKYGYSEMNWRKIEQAAEILGVTFDTQRNPVNIKTVPKPRLPDSVLNEALDAAVWKGRAA